MGFAVYYLCRFCIAIFVHSMQMGTPRGSYLVEGLLSYVNSLQIYNVTLNWIIHSSNLHSSWILEIITHLLCLTRFDQLKKKLLAYTWQALEISQIQWMWFFFQYIKMLIILPSIKRKRRQLATQVTHSKIQLCYLERYQIFRKIFLKCLMFMWYYHVWDVLH